MHASEVTHEAVTRANELYWQSDQSVNQIAEELDLSKGALYGIIQPEPSGLGCPLCGAEVGYANRTAKERGTLECPTCAWDGSADETTSYVERAESSSREREKVRARRGGSASSKEGGSVPGEDEVDEFLDDADLPAPLRPPPFVVPSMGTVARGALIGATVGLALVLWARRR
jgi:hypothetical protein